MSVGASLCWATERVGEDGGEEDLEESREKWVKARDFV